MSKVLRYDAMGGLVVLFFALAQFCDIATTLWIYKGPLYEVNPLTRYILLTFGPLVFVCIKFVLPLFAYLLVSVGFRYARMHRKFWVYDAAVFGVMLASVGTLLIVATNVVTLYQYQLL